MGGGDLISLKEFKDFKQKIPENIELLRKHYYEYINYLKIMEEEFENG